MLFCGKLDILRSKLHKVMLYNSTLACFKNSIEEIVSFFILLRLKKNQNNGDLQVTYRELQRIQIKRIFYIYDYSTLSKNHLQVVYYF